MRYITQGMVKPEKFNILVRLAGFTSEDVIQAMREHAVNGMILSTAADINDVKRPNLTKALNRLNEVASDVERCKEIDLAGKHD